MEDNIFIFFAIGIMLTFPLFLLAAQWKIYEKAGKPAGQQSFQFTTP